ncbi:MAG: phosphatidate cytidylyltransferase [Eubacterium sp.]
MVLSKFANKSFFTRLISGIVLVALMIGTIIPGGNILFAANLLISLAGVYELYKVLEIEKNTLGITGYVALIIYYALLYMGKTEYMMIFMVVFLIVLLAQYVFMFPKYKTEEISNAIMCMLYAGVMLSYLYSVREGNNGAYTVWLIFLCSWGSDTCAYVAGVALGKHKMAPVLSPKKSIEGAVGGVIGAAALGAIYAAVFTDKIQMSINPLIAFAVICAVGALISMVGDLAASAIKRNHNIKDYGKLIPGHGGIMDRFDSVIYVAPIIWILLQIF